MSPDEHILVLEREVAVLRQWKAEAMQVLSEWERVWEAAGRPGPLGTSKALAVLSLFTPGNPEGGWRLLDKYDADLLRCSDGVLIWDDDPAAAADEVDGGQE